MNTLLKLFSLKFIASLFGLLYSILQVRYFGASRTIEVYFAAQSLIYLVTSLTQSGQLAEIFLPEYHKLNTISRKLGFQGLNVVINRMLIWGGIIIFVIFIFAPIFINLLVPGFSVNDRSQAILMFRVLLPYLFLQLVNSFFITVLNAERKFGRAEFLGLTNTIVNILVLVLLYKSLGIWALVISLLLGKFIEFIFYSMQLYKIGFQNKFIFSIPEFNHKLFFKTMKSTILYVGATQFYSFVLTASISFLPEGIFAIFKYVQNLTNKIKGLFLQPFITIFFTEYSLLLQNSKSVIKEFQKYMGSLININTVTIIGTILIGDYVIDLLWGGKKFDITNVKLAYVFFTFNIVAIMLSSIGGIYRKMAIANGKGSNVYLYSVFSQLLSAIFAYGLIKYFTVHGLFFIIPINVFLLVSVSYLVYKKTDNPIFYKIINFNNITSLVIIFIAILIKYKTSMLFTYEYKYFIIMLVITLLLSLYPLFNIYRIFKVKKNHLFK